MKPSSLLICRADADFEICSGHVMRAIALGEAWRRAGGKAVLLTKSESWLRKRAANSFAEVYSLSDKHDFDETMSVIENVKRKYATEECWISLDGYHFDDHYQASFKESGHPLLVFDDYAHLPHYSADIILNQNAGAELLSYRTNHSKLLLGTDYVMLRDEFLSAMRAAEYSDAPARILVTMGGVDSTNATQIILSALADGEYKHADVRVLVGRANPHRESLERFIASNLNNTELIVQANDMSQHYQWSNMAIAAAGTTSWELCYFGVPSLLVQIADNQRALATHLAETGAAINLGWFSELSTQELKHTISSFLNDKSLRSKMSEQAKQLVDGEGGARLIREMSLLSDSIHRARSGKEAVLS